MHSSPPKRQKTSPTTSDRAHMHTKVRRAVSQDGDRIDLKRVSSMSPTKAGLARFDPHLLAGASLAEHIGSKTDSTPIISSGDTNGDSSPGLNALSSEQLNALAEGATSSSLRMYGKFVVGLKRWSQSSAEACVSPEKVRSGVVDDIRASPPEEAREGANDSGEFGVAGMGFEVNDNPAAIPTVNESHGMRLDSSQLIPSTPSRNQGTGFKSGMGQQEDGEPSLPSTPIHLGVEQPPEPAKGLLFSSPNHRLKRKRHVSARSSPLKPQASVLEPPHLVPVSLNPGLGPRVSTLNTTESAPTSQEIKFISLKDGLAVLEKHLQELEVGLIQQMLFAGWQDEHREGDEDISRQKEELVTQGARVIRSREEVRQVEFATFASRDLTVWELDQHDATSQRFTKDINIEFCPIPTNFPSLSRCLTSSSPSPEHVGLPICGPASLRDVDPPQIPLARAYSGGDPPFAISLSNISLLVNDTPQSALLQHQVIALSSQPQILYTALEVTVIIGSQDVTQLEVLQLSSWAEVELGSWLRAIRESSSLTTVGLAFGRYWETCRERLQCWRSISQDFDSLIVDGATEIPVSLDDTYDEGLASWLCRQNIQLTRNNVRLDINWSILIDDVGEVESITSASVTYPSKWGQTEIGPELDKVGKAFDLLVKEDGVVQAVTTISKLVFSDP